LNLNRCRTLLLEGLLLFACSACTYQLSPQINSDTLGHAPGRLALFIILDMPVEFQEYEYVASYDGREIRYQFGHSMEQSFQTYLEGIFKFVIAKEAALDSLQYDFVAIPTFLNTHSFVTLGTFAVEPNIKVDFISGNGQNRFSVIGKGRGEAKRYSEGPLLEAGNQAINSALQDLRRNIYSSAELGK
jgi:hypothetical protein